MNKTLTNIKISIYKVIMLKYIRESKSKSIINNSINYDSSIKWCIRLDPASHWEGPGAPKFLKNWLTFACSAYEPDHILLHFAPPGGRRAALFHCHGLFLSSHKKRGIILNVIALRYTWEFELKSTVNICFVQIKDHQ